MQVYSGWPQLLSTRSSTSWKAPTSSPLGTEEVGHSTAVVEMGWDPEAAKPCSSRATQAAQMAFGGLQAGRVPSLSGQPCPLCTLPSGIRTQGWDPPEPPLLTGEACWWGGATIGKKTPPEHLPNMGATREREGQQEAAPNERKARGGHLPVPQFTG